MNDQMTPRKELRAARVALRLNQREAAAMTGLTASSISDYEKGEARGSGDASKNFIKICLAYAARAAQPEFGYDPALFHESVLFPGEFPPPAGAKLSVVEWPVANRQPSAASNGEPEATTANSRSSLLNNSGGGSPSPPSAADESTVEVE